MSYKNVQLDQDVPLRYEVHDGKVDAHTRDDAYMMYGMPRHEDAFIWRESDRCILVLRDEVHKQGERRYGCYHSMPSLNAAIMFVFAAT